MVSQNRRLFRQHTQAQQKRHAIRDVQFAQPGYTLTIQSERTEIENKWFALTDRVVELKVEEYGDLHPAQHDRRISPNNNPRFTCENAAATLTGFEPVLPP